MRKVCRCLFLAAARSSSAFGVCSRASIVSRLDRKFHPWRTVVFELTRTKSPYLYKNHQASSRDSLLYSVKLYEGQLSRCIRSRCRSADLWLEAATEVAIERE